MIHCVFITTFKITWDHPSSWSTLCNCTQECNNTNFNATRCPHALQLTLHGEHESEPSMGVTTEAHLLFPRSITTILALECSLASSSHELRCSNVSRLCTQTYTKMMPYHTTRITRRIQCIVAWQGGTQCILHVL